MFVGVPLWTLALIVLGPFLLLLGMAMLFLTAPPAHRPGLPPFVGLVGVGPLGFSFLLLPPPLVAEWKTNPGGLALVYTLLGLLVLALSLLVRWLPYRWLTSLLPPVARRPEMADEVTLSLAIILRETSLLLGGGMGLAVVWGLLFWLIGLW